MKKIIKFFKSDKFYLPPQKKKYLILDSFQFFVFNDYLNIKDTNIMDTRYESINLYILFKTLINFKFSFKGYIEEYIKCSGCEIIISFIDNNIFYYQLKNLFPQKKIILIQNGMRTEFFFKNLSKSKDLKVDHLLTFSNFYSKKYRQNIEGDLITIGSFKNNLIEKKNLTKDNSIAFISSGPLTKKNMNIFREINLENKIYFEPEKKLLPIIAEFCNENKMTLKVVARSKEIKHMNYEKKFYDEILKNYDYNFVDSNGYEKVYHIADTSSVSVSIYSAFGLETVARGNRTIFFNVRDKATNFESLNLFWSENKLKEKGNFWSDEINRSEVFRVLNYALKSKDSEWENSLKEIIPLIIFSDPKNKIFIDLLKKLN